MGIPQSIRQRGFRKWYERELLHGHSHLVLLLFCVLAFIGGLEAFTARGEHQLILTTCLLVAGLVGAWALRRYLRVLMRAEFIANQAACPGCKAYARWLVEQHDVNKDGVAMSVCCRGCGHRWRIEW